MCVRPVSPVNFSGGLLEDTNVSNANLGFTNTNDPESWVVARVHGPGRAPGCSWQMKTMLYESQQRSLGGLYHGDFAAVVVFSG